MGNSNLKETCPSERSSSASLHFTYVNTRSNYQLSWETCPLDMANDASLNVIAPYEKEEIEHSDVIETCPSEMDYNASQKCIGPSELEEMDLSDLKEYIRSNIEIIRSLNNKNIVPEERKTIDLDDMDSQCEEAIESCAGVCYNCGQCHTLDIRTRIEEYRSLMMERRTMLEENRMLEMERQTMLEENRMLKMRGSLNKQQTYLNEYLQNKEEKTARNKYLIYLLMFGNIVCSGLLATSERGNLSSVLGYLLGNDGAHSYNGNGLPLTTMRPATLPMNVLFRKPTNKEIAIIATKMGRQFIPLACFLGFGEAELDQLEDEYRDTVARNTKLLRRWRDTKDTNPTVKKLADAFHQLNFDPYIVYNSLETADKLPKEFLLRELTDIEIARILMKTTIMCVSLAILLGFTKAQLDEMRKVFNQVLKIFEMFKMEDAQTSIVTIEKVIDVLGELGINPDIVPDIISSSLG